MFRNSKVIGFDADDTLWVNEPYFKELEAEFCELLQDYLPEKESSKILFQTEVNNIELYGYGVKAFMLSLIESAIKISKKNVPVQVIEKIIELGKQQLNKPVILLDGVEKVLRDLTQKNYKLIVATKGDLLDQERKLQKSGIEKYFHHIEIMSNKNDSDYQKLLKHLEIKPEEFVMIGNSLKSDILPVLNIGGTAIYIPFHTVWEHESVHPENIHNGNYTEVKSIEEIIGLF
ncbi:MAG: HAD family hydrolase [Bacteroidetes bacterium]|nr:HAD family hydrolase [Bacteroidota bacterium]